MTEHRAHAYAATLTPLWDTSDKPGGENYRRALERGLPRQDMYAPAFRARAQKANRERIEAQRAETEAVEAELDGLKKRQRLAVAAIAKVAELDAKISSEDPLRIIAAARKRAQEILTLAEAEATERRSVRAIQREIAETAGFTVATLIGPSRNKLICRLRDAAIAKVHQSRPELSLTQIGRLFGNRDHTTILHSLKKTGAYLGADRSPL